MIIQSNIKKFPLFSNFSKLTNLSFSVSLFIFFSIVSIVDDGDGVHPD